jgi:glycosyltransferase involved in cell wall biosynthesis
MPLSLIISIYKRLDFLNLALQSVDQQSFRDFEVIIAEDDNQNETKVFLDQNREKFDFQIKHVYQEDLGFRKNRILNRALREVKSNKIVFIDGDCLLHKNFLLNYDRGIKVGIARAGRRIELSQKITAALLNKGIYRQPNIIDILFSGSKYPEKALYLPWIKTLNSGFKHLLGCNWGVHIEDLKKINGFDEDYEKSGVGEDSDVEWRLLKAGIKIDSIVYSALEYHLNHTVHYNQETLDENLKMLKNKKSKGDAFCENGLKRI